jgi:hypothetical protein
MASAKLSRRVGKVVGQPPLSELGDLQRRQFYEALLEAGFEDLPERPTFSCDIAYSRSPTASRAC